NRLAESILVEGSVRGMAGDVVELGKSMLDGTEGMEEEWSAPLPLRRERFLQAGPIDSGQEAEPLAPPLRAAADRIDSLGRVLVGPALERIDHGRACPEHKGRFGIGGRWEGRNRWFHRQIPWAQGL